MTEKGHVHTNGYVHRAGDSKEQRNKELAALGWPEDELETVYVLQAGAYFKIGMTSGDVKRRIKELQPGNPHQIVIFATLETWDARDYENKLHQRFSKCRLRGEWFALDADAIQFIRELAGDS